MKKMLNTLFAINPDGYLSLENDNVVIWDKTKENIVTKLPLLDLENILYFGYPGVSPALLGACAEKKIGFCFLNQQGRLLARVAGQSRGNVLLRMAQYKLSDNPNDCLCIARNIIAAKISNARKTLARGMRDHHLCIDMEAFGAAVKEMASYARLAYRANDLDELRGIEGSAAKVYFSCLGDLILNDKTHFFFKERNRRPPLDRFNALLSFGYTILAHEYAYALEAVGLDAYAGFLHRLRPGRESLALDMMEELRSIVVDRFALTIINKGILKHTDFKVMEDGAVWLKDDAKKTFMTHWHERKKESLTHPYLGEKIPWGMIPFAQAQLLARFIRNDIDGYPAFFLK